MQDLRLRMNRLFLLQKKCMITCIYNANTFHNSTGPKYRFCHQYIEIIDHILRLIHTYIQWVKKPPWQEKSISLLEGRSPLQVLKKTARNSYGHYTESIVVVADVILWNFLSTQIEKWKMEVRIALMFLYIRLGLLMSPNSQWYTYY